MADRAYTECPWDTEPWSCTEDSSDSGPDPTAASAHDAYAHSFALAQVRQPQTQPMREAAQQPMMIRPKAPPPQHLLSNAAQMLPPLPAGPRHLSASGHMPALPTPPFCARYQNLTCRRQCALHMTPLQRTHAHVFALHGLPVAALLPPRVRFQHLVGLSHLASAIWLCLTPQSRHAFHAADWWTASDCRWYSSPACPCLPATPTLPQSTAPAHLPRMFKCDCALQTAQPSACLRLSATLPLPSGCA